MVVVDLDYNVSSLPNFLFSFFGFRFRRELDNSIFLREGEGGRHIGVKTTFHHNESGKLAHIHPTLVSI